MTVLRCERLANGEVDAAVASLGAVALARLSAEYSDV